MPSSARADRDIGSIVLTGAGDKAFCTGGDQSDHAGGQYGNNDARGAVGMPVEEFHSVLRDVPAGIAKVRGYAIGGGNVFATLRDRPWRRKRHSRPVGPKMGSVDPGFGTAYLARVVGEKKAREMWYLQALYRAGSLAMGLVNAVYPDDELDDAVRSWCGGAQPAQPDRDRPRQEELQRGHRIHPRYRAVRDAGPQALLWHRRIAGRGTGAEREARPDFLKYYK